MTDFDHTAIDELLQSRVRLAIVAFLASAKQADFSVLRDAIKTSDGNASVHLRKLEDAGYIAVEKRFVARKPQTRYALTDRGRKALLDYVTHLESLLPPPRSGRGRQAQGAIMRAFFNDLLSTIFFLVIQWISGNIYAATAIAIAAGLAQMGQCIIVARKIDPMRWLSLGLVVVFGGATLATRDPRFVMITPTIIHFALAAIMLRRGWLKRYLPAIVAANVSHRVIVGSGYAWAALMMFLGIANLIIAVTFDVRVWVAFVSFGAIGAKLAFLALQYGLFRTLVVRRPWALRDRAPLQSADATLEPDRGAGSLQRALGLVLAILVAATSRALAGEAVSFAPAGPAAAPWAAVPAAVSALSSLRSAGTRTEAARW